MWLVRRDDNDSTPIKKPVYKESPILYGLPDGYNIATSFGDGGGNATMVKSGFLIGWLVGGGNRSEVYGKTFHPETPAPNTLPWGFLPIATFLDVYPSDSDVHRYYQNLPQKIPRPGGELVEMKITLFNDSFPLGTGPKKESPPFFFISDLYTALETRNAINYRCYFIDSYISPPIPFNSTGNIKLGSVVQYYRGDSAAIVLQGYNNSEELPGRPDLIYNPPFPPNVSYHDWRCVNTTIGDAIPIIHGVTPLPAWFNALSAVIPIMSLILAIASYRWYLRVRNKRKGIRTPNDERDNLVGDGDPEPGNDNPSRSQELDYEMKAKSNDSTWKFESTRH